MADLVISRRNRDHNGPVGIHGAARGGIVGQEILSSEFAVDAIEDSSQFLWRVGIKHGAAGSVGHGFESVLPGGVAAAFVFYRADNDGVKEAVGEGRLLASCVEIGAAGGFARGGPHDDHAGAGTPPAPKGPAT